ARQDRAPERRRRRRLPIPRSEGISSSPLQAHVVAVPSTSAAPYRPSIVRSGLHVVGDPFGVAVMTGAQEAIRLHETGWKLTRSHSEIYPPSQRAAQGQ